MAESTSTCPEVAALADIDSARAPGQTLRHDLLPGWYEEWLMRSRTSSTCNGSGAEQVPHRNKAQDFGLATSAGLAAVCAEPLRESAVTALVAAHLGEGNRYEAVRRYHDYASLLRRELDVEPSAELAALMSPFAGAG
jgi:hypothetical protein